MTPQHFAAGVHMPVLMIQVPGRRLDLQARGRAEDLRPTRQQQEGVLWIENTTRRFKDGYNHFGQHPEKVIGFFDAHMK